MPDETAPLDLESLLTDAVKEALRHEDPERFQRWLMKHLERYMMPAYQGGEHEAMRSTLAVHLGRALWNVMPLPGNDLRPKPIRPPGGNDPCPCGSGRKFTHCCANAPSLPETAIDSESMLALVVREMPAARLNVLVAKGTADTLALVMAAHRYLEEDHLKKAASALEPLFDLDKGQAPSERGAGEALYLLCDVYDELGFWRKKTRLLETLTSRLPSSQVRGLAWGRLAAIRADAGDLDAAAEAFQHAQRDDPDDPDLASLEVAIWANSGRYEQARERARFWHRRLQRKGIPEESHPMPFLTRAIEDPATAMVSAVGRVDPLIQRLEIVIERARCRPLPAYTAQPLAHGAALRPPERVARVEKRWYEQIAPPKPLSIDERVLDDAWQPWEEDLAERWLGFIEAHGDALDSIEILDDIVSAVFDHPLGDDPSVCDALILPLLQRAAAIIEAAVGRPPAVTLPWADTDNRSALRSLIRLWAFSAETGQANEASDTAEWLLRLNPADELGLRVSLALQYLEQSRDEDLIALAAMFPDDMWPELNFGRALALLRQRRTDEADAALEAAVARHPQAAEFLSRKRVRKPSGDDGGYMTGEDDAHQAWRHREAVRPIWEATPGALEWLERTRSRHA